MMNDREMAPWGNLVKQWEGETPLLLTDQAVGQLLAFAQETERQLSQQKEQIQTLTVKMAELRAQMRGLGEKGGLDV